MRKLRIVEHSTYDLGPGKRLFSDTTAARKLSLVSTHTTPTGLLLNTYRHLGLLQIPTTPS